MPIVAETSSSSSTTIAEHIRLRRRHNLTTHQHQHPTIPDDVSVTEPPLEPSRFSKSAISSFFLFPISSSSSNETTQTKKKPSGFPQTSSFRGLGCAAGSTAASRQVSVPAVIRSSADWESKKVKKKVKKKKSDCISNGGTIKIPNEVEGGSCVAIPDVWCGPGIGFSTDAVVSSSVDPVASGAPRRNIQGRRKIDGERMSDSHRESSLLFPRQSINPDSLAFLDTDSAFATQRPEPALLPGRHRRQIRYPSPDGLPEIMMLQNGFLMGGRLESRDLFRDLRLDVENMSYEQLLELGERIGHVSTGLKDDEIERCLRRIRPPSFSIRHSHLTALADKKCSICQEEYEEDEGEEEAGKLNCGHRFHYECIKQWLSRKNTCPVCKIPPFTKP